MTITLLTDFGLHDPYVGVMKGVILGICPDVQIVDICHEILPQNIDSAAFVLGKTYSYFPDGIIHVWLWILVWEVTGRRSSYREGIRFSLHLTMVC